LLIMDFSDISSPTVLGVLDEYSAYFQGYNHSGWLSEDGNIYAFADETHGSPIKICDVSDPNNITILSTVKADNLPSADVPHNLMIKNNYLFISYYYDGLIIFDISDPENPKKIAAYDTYPGENQFYFDGAWGIYAFLPSGNLLVSDTETGLYVFDWPNNEPEPEVPLSSQELSNDSGVQITAFKSKLNIQLKLAQAQKVQIELFDLKGHLLHTHQSQLGIGSQNIELDLLDIPSNYSIVKVRTKSGIYSQKIYLQ